ncbi:MAG: hypothetical protein AUJ34_01970 [Parcubacteria group bacterium CG1_02_41_12]|nr:MAG: hypothetical protein AUJ34_01970 [Parcubacteria group bacterium CG1_02_41_12]PIQ79287.1 MAG: hypothetical protein COV79_03960 [Parcubacteria group bacterium CG11_big_fil_rev_8_21_14_0_20_41_14]
MKQILTSILLLAITAQPLQAAQFNANNIISDYELEDYTSLSQDSVQRFLESKGSFLARFTEVINNVRKTAAQIIYEESQLYRINPKVILAMLQKEQSLITSASPSQNQLDWATGFAVCDSCSKSDPTIQQYKGFYNQVSLFAEKVQNNYLRDLKSLGKTYTGWGRGRTKTTIDRFEITPVNNATAVLYTYNPWRGSDTGVGANYNFWKIWNRYFVRNYPDGTLLQEQGEQGVWLLQNEKRRPFKTRAALYSRYDASRIIQVSKNELETYEVGPSIEFANYSLLRAPYGTIYLLVDDAIRGIESMEVFRTIGFNPEEVIDVEEKDLALYTIGANITLASAYPTGALLQDNKTGAVFFVQDGKRYGLIDRSIMNLRFKNQKPLPIHPDELNQYAYAAPLKLQDGTIITSPESSSVYVISAGKRRPVISGEAFEKLGFKWDNIHEVPQKVVDLHPLGDPLDLIITYGEGEILGDNTK